MMHDRTTHVFRRTVARFGIAFATLCCCAALPVLADDADKEQAAIRAAVARVAPAVLRIETVGGLERVGQLLTGTGPTTGFLVDPNGYIVSSAFNFVHKPTSILVRLPGGARKSAKLVATDHSRMVVLLKVELEKPITFDAGKATGKEAGAKGFYETVPVKDMRVGEWTIAVGRTFEADRPNLTVGILSAVNRVWGKAIQTDAAVSPNNYGGPLIDISGRVLGILVPLSPEAADEITGVEWYDSGIGFAVPMEQIEAVLPRLKKGEDLYPGRAGFSLKGPNVYTNAPIIVACRSKSPAANAGLRRDDRIVAIDDRTITREAEVKEEIGRRYAGQSMRITVLRDKDRLERTIELVAKLPPFQHGFLGILPMRSESPNGVPIRFVYPDSPAAKAELAAGDVIVSLQGAPVRNRIELMQKLGVLEPTAEVDLEIRRGETVRKVKIPLATIPETPPPTELPSPVAQKASSKDAQTPAPKDKEKHPKVGLIQLKVPEFPNKVAAYVPEAYDEHRAYGVVVWLRGNSSTQDEELTSRWKPLCDRHDLIWIAPQPTESNRWTPAEMRLIDRLLVQTAQTYNIDPTRIVVHGYENGGSQAFLAAYRNREMIRAVAAVEAVPSGSPPENDPMRRLAFYVAASSQSRAGQSAAAGVAALRKNGFPVMTKSLGEAPRYLDADELAELGRWIDALDRI